MSRYTHTMCMAFGADGEPDRVEVDVTFDYLVAGSAVSDIRVLKIDGRDVNVADADLHDRIHDDLESGRFDDLLISLVTQSPVGGGYDASDVRYGLHLIANEDCDEVAASYYAKKALAHLAAPAPGGEVMNDDAPTYMRLAQALSRHPEVMVVERSDPTLELTPDSLEHLLEDVFPLAATELVQEWSERRARLRPTTPPDGEGR